MELLRRPSIQLNKSSTVLKTIFYENAPEYFFELEIWQPIRYIFFRPARSTISSQWEPTGTMVLLCRPSIQFNKSLTVLKTTFYENAPEFFLSSKSDNQLSTFSSDQLDQRSTISSPWEPIRNMTMTLLRLRSPSIQLNNSLTVLKTTFYENAPEYFLSLKSENLLANFFSDQLDQQLDLPGNLIGLWNSYLDPQFNWTSPWLYWKPLFLKTHQNIFCSKSYNILSTFFQNS